MAVNWALGLQQGGNAGDAFAQSFKQGQADNEKNMARSAMARLVQNPNDPRALAALAQVDPQTAMEFRQQQAALAKSQLAEHQDSILKGAEILRQFQPKDQASYSQALAAAQQAGIDVSEVPQQYNPQYVDGIMKLADTFAPQPNSQLVPFPDGGGVARINPQTHQPEVLIAPNAGGHPAGAPVGSGPSAQAIAYLKANPALAPQFEQKYGAGSAAAVLGNGGQTAPPSGTFPQ